MTHRSSSTADQRRLAHTKATLRRCTAAGETLGTALTPPPIIDNLLGGVVRDRLGASSCE